MSELKMSEGFMLTVPVGAYGGEQAELNGLLLQHCVVPTYQLIIQMAPEQVTFCPLAEREPICLNHPYLVYNSVKRTASFRSVILETSLC